MERKIFGIFGMGEYRAEMREVNRGIDLIQKITEQLATFGSGAEDGQTANVFFALANATAFQTALGYLEERRRSIAASSEELSDRRPLATKGAHGVYNGR